VLKAIALQSWAGLRYEPVEVLGETPKRFRVKILNDKAKLAGRNNWASRGDVILVPKHAVREISEAEYERNTK
jgi:hypothetical protein